MSRRLAHPNVLQAITSRCWAATPEAINMVWEIANRLNESPEAIAARLGRPLDNARSVTTRNGVATIPVAGPMFRYADFFTEISGAVSYETLATDIQAAIDAPDVHTILLEINSPGGDADGISSLAELVYQARDEKRIVAIASDYACSAAYFLAAAAHEVVSSPSGILGSIGTRAAYRDTSKRDAMEGVETIEIVSDQSPDKAPDITTDEGKAKVRETLNALTRVFVGAVARYRGVSEEAVLTRFGRGGVLVGTDAVAAGLADRIATYEQLHAELSAARGDARSTGATNPPPGRTPAEETRMASGKKNRTAASAANSGRPVAEDPAFQQDAGVTVGVSRSVSVSEGDAGTIVEVRNGPHYAVSVGEDSTYMWLSEDELQSAGQSDGEEAGGDGDSAPAESEASARAPRALTTADVARLYPPIAAHFRAEGATAERARLAAIDAIGSPAHAKLVSAAKADASMTAEKLAVQILAAERKAQGNRATALQKDEEQLDAPTPLDPDATETSGSAASESAQILSIFNANRGKARRGA